jgi:hypothetical protein
MDRGQSAGRALVDLLEPNTHPRNWRCRSGPLPERDVPRAAPGLPSVAAARWHGRGERLRGHAAGGVANDLPHGPADGPVAAPWWNAASIVAVRAGGVRMSHVEQQRPLAAVTSK